MKLKQSWWRYKRMRSKAVILENLLWES